MVYHSRFCGKHTTGFNHSILFTAVGLFTTEYKYSDTVCSLQIWLVLGVELLNGEYVVMDSSWSLLSELCVMAVCKHITISYGDVICYFQL